MASDVQAGRSVQASLEPPVDVSDYDVACELARMLATSRPSSSKIGEAAELDRVLVAFRKGGALGVYALVRDRLAEERRQNLAGAAAIFARFAAAPDAHLEAAHEERVSGDEA